MLQGLALVAACSSLCAHACLGPRTQGELAAELWGAGSGYDLHTRPNWAVAGNAAAPTDLIQVQIQVYNVLEVDTKEQTFTVEALVRVVWWDMRLMYKNNSEGGCFYKPKAGWDEVGFDGSFLNQIWTPGIQVANLADDEQVIYSAFWLYTDGMVWWARKSIVKLSCNMRFEELPYDAQYCPMTMVGWRDVAYDIDMDFLWDMPSNMTQSQGGSAEWTLHHIRGKLLREDAPEFLWEDGVGVQWVFQIGRNPKYYEQYILLPNGILVGIAWLSFFVSRSAAPARVGMLLLLVVCVTTQELEVQSSLPRCSGTVWLLTYLECSKGFVLYAILEYVVCNFLSRIEQRVDKARAAYLEGRAKGAAGSKASTSSIAGGSGGVAQAPETAAVEVCAPDSAGGEPEEEKDELRQVCATAAGRCGCIFVRPCGRLILRDQHVEIFSRYAFPVTYAICFAVLTSSLSGAAEMEEGRSRARARTAQRGGAG